MRVLITFLIGLAILMLGGLIYGRVCEKVFGPDDRKTPAERLNDGVDFVPMPKWKNCLIQLLNIAGTGPIMGPIQGAVFGPVAFITIPVGCVLGGALHDYMVGMISMRNDGAQMPEMIGRYMGRRARQIYRVFVSLLLILLGTVFIYTPGDLFVSQMLKTDSGAGSPVLWIVYGLIFVYYFIAALFPVDKIIGRIYPIFGGVLIISALGIFAGLFIHGYPLAEVWETGIQAEHFVPLFFVTVACGVVSGFHSTQSTIVSRTMRREKEGRMSFYNMMIVEGFIAMTWAAATMGLVNLGKAAFDMSPTDMIGSVAMDMLGSVGGLAAVLSVIVLGVTSGDTALRALRIMIGDALGLNQAQWKKRMVITLVIFAAVAGMLVFFKTNENGFNMLWRYFSWANQTLAVLAFAMISVYLKKEKRPFVMALIPGMFYAFVVSSFILSASIGFGLNWTLSYALAGVMTALYAVAVAVSGRRAVENGLKN